MNVFVFMYCEMGSLTRVINGVLMNERIEQEQQHLLVFLTVTVSLLLVIEYSIPAKENKNNEKYKLYVRFAARQRRYHIVMQLALFCMVTIPKYTSLLRRRKRMAHGGT